MDNCDLKYFIAVILIFVMPSLQATRADTTDNDPLTKQNTLSSHISRYEEARAKADTFQLILATGKLGSYHSNASRSDSAVYYCRQLHGYIKHASAELRNTINLDTIREVIYNSGIQLLFNDLIQENALELFQILLDMSEKADDTLYMSKANFGIGYVRRDSNADEAINFFRKAANLAENIDGPAYVSSLNEIANSHMLIGNLDSALIYHHRALENSEGLEAHYKNMILHDIGHLYAVGMGDYETAIDYFRKSLDYYLSAEDTRASIIVSYNLADTYYRIGEYQKAEEYFRVAQKIRQNSGSDILGADLYRLSALISAGLNDYERAFNQSVIAMRYLDSLHSAETEHKIAEIHTRYQTEKKETENRLLKQEKKLQQLELEKEKRLRQSITTTGVIAVVFFIILLSVIVLFYRNKSRYARELANNNQIIESQKTELENALEKLSTNEAKLREANAMKDKFFSIIAHDLKNPFNAILGFTGLLKESFSELDEKEKLQMISQINNAAENTYRLLENLLQWSRSQMDMVKHKPEVFDLKPVIDENIELVKDMASQKDIEIRSSVKVKLSVFANTEMVSVIVRNLISNAIKFTNRNGSVDVSAEQNGKFVHVTVADNGIGMTNEEKDKIFRIDAGFKKKGTDKEVGTGLGLVLCKEFVEKNGGSLIVESAPGEGSKFIFTLPLSN